MLRAVSGADGGVEGCVGVAEAAGVRGGEGAVEFAQGLELAQRLGVRSSSTALGLRKRDCKANGAWKNPVGMT